MKSVNYSLVRAICALIIGLILITWPGVAADYLVITIGILFIIPGVVGVIGYFASKKDTVKYRFPLEAVGSALFGLWLVITPGFFVNILMYVLGIILLLGGMHQLYALMLARRWTRVSVGFFIMPVLILLASIYIIFSPRESQQTLFIIIGITAVVYAAVELINYFRFINRKPRVHGGTEIVEAEIIED